MKSNSLPLSFKKDAKKISTLLQQGYVLAGGSDTVIGLLAQATEKGFKQLCFLKKRDEKRFIILVDCKEKIFDFVESSLSVQAEKLVACWPAPLTLIFNAKKDIPSYCISPQKTVALRVPAYPGLQEILRQTGPLFSTSANLSGLPVPTNVAEIDPTILQSVAAVIAVDQQLQRPSTIIDCSQQESRVIRWGAFSLTDIERCTGITFIS